RGTRHIVADLAEIEPVHYEGVVWCLTVPTGAFVVRRNGKVFVTGNSGFPKSHDVGKAIDKAAGAEREVVGYSQGRSSAIHGGGQGVGRPAPLTTPARDAAKQWAGWGTALQPAVEPIAAARQPFTLTVAANVLEHGTGALNIDASRVGMSDADREAAKVPMGDWSRSGTTGSTDSRNGATFEPSPAGRWPANVILDEHMAGALDEQSGVLKSGALTPTGRKKKGYVYGLGHKTSVTNTFASSEGGASRFFYVAKAPKRERPEVNGVKHTTVKPLTLMRYLVRMVTPPGGIVLDPFAGSG